MKLNTDNIRRSLYGIMLAIPDEISWEDFEAYYDVLLELAALVNGGTARRDEIAAEIREAIARLRR